MSSPLPVGQTIHRRALVAAGGEAVESKHAAGTAQLARRHPLLVTGLEAHGRPGGNVEPSAERRGAIARARETFIESDGEWSRAWSRPGRCLRSAPRPPSLARLP